MNKTILTFLIATIILGFCALTTRAATACDHRLIIVNHSDIWVDAVYATNVNNGKWGPNRIQNAICPHCQSIVTLNDRSGYIYYDIRAIGEYGEFFWEQDWRNICVFTTWDLYNPN